MLYPLIPSVLLGISGLTQNKGFQTEPTYVGFACLDEVYNRPNMYEFRLFKQPLNNSAIASQYFLKL